MNQATRYVLGIYQLGVLIRDSFEYGIPKKEYNLETYNQRKANIKHCVESNSPFMHFLSQQSSVPEGQEKSIGEEIRKNVTDFIDLVYGEEARAAHIEDNKLIVDPAFSTQVFDYIVGLHETISDITKGYVEQSKTNGTYYDKLEELVKKDDVFFRCISSLVLTDAIHRLFVEFNRTMNEAKGEQNPQSSFVANELNKVIGFYNFVQNHSKVEDEKYKNNVELTKKIFSYISGAEKLEEGKNLRDEFQHLHEEWTKVSQVSELDWRKTYVEIWQELVDFERDLQAQNQKNNEDKKAN